MRYACCGLVLEFCCSCCTGSELLFQNQVFAEELDVVESMANFFPCSTESRHFLGKGPSKRVQLIWVINTMSSFLQIVPFGYLYFFLRGECTKSHELKRAQDDRTPAFTLQAFHNGRRET